MTGQERFVAAHGAWEDVKDGVEVLVEGMEAGEDSIDLDDHLAAMWDGGMTIREVVFVANALEYAFARWYH